MNKKFGATLFSRALYSSWCHVPKYGLLFDCGEGCALNLGNDTANVTRCLLTHSHGDHTLGLISFIGARNNAQGISRNPATRDHNKSLEVFYPEIGAGIPPVIDFIEKRNREWLNYDLKWTPIQVGSIIDLSPTIYVEAFEMSHDQNILTLGYVIKERRKRLKPEFVGKNIAEMIKSGVVDKNILNEDFSTNLFAYCLDAYSIHGDLTDCEHVVMDCTFLDKEDRTKMTHFTINEALEFCHNAGIKNMYAAHVSPRYDGKSIYNYVPFMSSVTNLHPIDSMTPNFI